MKKHYEDFDEEDAPISKSALKREMTALQELGAQLVALDAGVFASFNIADEDLLEALREARRLKSREGLRRQMQYIGKLMRNTDVEPLRRGLEDLAAGRREKARRFHELEKLRDNAIGEGPQAIEHIIELYPDADRQHVRQLVLQARREQKAERPPAAARKLFRYLKEFQG